MHTQRTGKGACLKGRLSGSTTRQPGRPRSACARIAPSSKGCSKAAAAGYTPNAGALMRTLTFCVRLVRLHRLCPQPIVVLLPCRLLLHALGSLSGALATGGTVWLRRRGRRILLLDRNGARKLGNIGEHETCTAAARWAWGRG